MPSFDVQVCGGQMVLNTASIREARDFALKCAVEAEKRRDDRSFWDEVREYLEQGLAQC